MDRKVQVKMEISEHKRDIRMLSSRVTKLSSDLEELEKELLEIERKENASLPEAN